MKNPFIVSLFALCAMAVSASAADISFTGIDTLTPPGDWSTLYGGDHYMVYDFSSGKPDIFGGYYTKGGTNPSYLDSLYWGIGGSGGSEGDIYYGIGLNEGKCFDFTVLFYDSTYGTDNGLDGTDVALSIRLLGYNDLDDPWHEVTVAELEHGVFLTWDVIVYADDDDMSVLLDIDFVNGAGAYAAGFFFDNVTDVPEPGTIGLMLFGLAGFVTRPRRHR